MRGQAPTVSGALSTWAAFLGLAWPEEQPAAPAFTLPDLRGQPISLEDYAGSVVLINFWATWCRECVWEIPELEKLSQAYRAQGLIVLAVALDRHGKELVGEYLIQERVRVTFPVLLDPDRRVARVYRVTGIPVTMIVGRDGALIGAVYGAQRWGSPKVMKQIKTFLGQ